jgi:hypothetical protein
MGNLYQDNDYDTYIKCIDGIISVFDTNNFGTQFLNSGGVAPDENFKHTLDIIKQKMNEIKNLLESKSDVFFDVISESSFNYDKFLGYIREIPIELTKEIFKFVHNRIGSKLSDAELKNVSTTLFNADGKSKLCVYTPDGNETNTQFALFIKIINTDAGAVTYQILSTDTIIYNMNNIDDIKYTLKNVERDHLKDYSAYLDQHYKTGVNGNILETYLMSMRM